MKNLASVAVFNIWFNVDSWQWLTFLWTTLYMPRYNPDRTGFVPQRHVLHYM